MLCLTRDANDHLTFLMLLKKLLGRMSKQGNQNSDISRLLNKVFGRHFEVFNKLAVTDKDSIYFLNCKYELKYKIIVTLQLSCKFLFCLIVCSYG